MFPRDIVQLLEASPRLLGHGQPETEAGDSDYLRVSERSRRDFLSLATSGSREASTEGRPATVNALPLVIRPSMSAISPLALFGSLSQAELLSAGSELPATTASAAYAGRLGSSVVDAAASALAEDGSYAPAAMRFLEDSGTLGMRGLRGPEAAMVLTRAGSGA